MTKTDLSTEALLVRREIAEKATPGPWEKADTESGFINISMYCVIGDGVRPAFVASPNDAAHIAANSPDVVQADIDEILRLRAEVERLEKEADWLATAVANIGWVGRRVSPEDMREAARNAV